MEQAERQAKEQGRPVLLYFTASDWNEECKLLKTSVLDTPEFKRFADEKLILLELDFPNDKPQPAEITAANAAIARKYGVRGFPTVVLLNLQTGKQNRYGYVEGGPVPFIKAMNEAMAGLPATTPAAAKPAEGAATNQTAVIKAPVMKGTLGWAVVDTPATPAPPAAGGGGGTLTPRPGIVMTTGPDGQVAFYGPSATSRTAVIPETATPTPAMARGVQAPKAVHQQLVLKGITGSATRPLALINSRTFSPGESSRLTIAGKQIKVTCQSIALDHVMVLVEDDPTPQKLVLEP